MNNHYRRFLIKEIKDLAWDIHRTCEKLSNYYSSIDEDRCVFSDYDVWTVEDYEDILSELKDAESDLDKFIESHIDGEEWVNYG